MRPIAISARKVEKTYAGSKVFKNLSFTLHRGNFTVLLGKNGAGKSTLLRLIAGLEAADDGRIKVLGSDIEEESLERRQRTALVSEQVHVDPSSKLNALLIAYRPLQPNWDQPLFNKFIKNFNLTLDRPFGSLSRGQRVQFFFALAAASRPKLYLLDEVTSVLDANARFEVMSHLRRETEDGASVILATNIAAEAHNFANEILFLLNGKLGLNCSVDALQNNFTKFRAHSDRSAPKEARPVQLNRDGSISYLIPKEFATRALVSDLRGVTIEDVFVYFTGPEEK